MKILVTEMQNSVNYISFKQKTDTSAMILEAHGYKMNIQVELQVLQIALESKEK